MVGVIEEHGSMIEKMGSGVQNDILTLRAEMMEQGRRLIAELVEQERRLRLLETLADMAWYRRWWWVLSGRGL